MNYKIVEEFLANLKKEFGGGDEEAVLKRLEWGGKMMKEFIQKFRKTVRENRYKRRPLIKDFKRGMNRTVCQRLMKLE